MQIEDLLQDDDFSDIMMAHCADILDFLLETEESFSIVCDLAAVEFKPQLPTEITNGLKPMTLFEISGYTLESAEVSEGGDFLYFEAAFGPRNFESSVLVQIDAILQILVETTPIFVNLTALPQNRAKKPFRVSMTGDENIDRSMQSFLDDPENKKFFE
ncbi:MAG: hypothetical protein LBU73_09375 [Helicobacteraceae bacterium]|jgi:hypothetical protein|nr:hypothetical protein [Helicobacteraceae bacterium]